MSYKTLTTNSGASVLTTGRLSCPRRPPAECENVFATGEGADVILFINAKIFDEIGDVLFADVFYVRREGGLARTYLDPESKLADMMTGDGESRRGT